MQMEIENIEYGNKIFNTFCTNEALFVKMFRTSKAYRYSVMQVFAELVRLGVYPPLSKIKQQPLWEEVVVEEKKLFASVNHHDECCIAYLVISHFAELRLKKTSGV